MAARKKAFEAPPRAVRRILGKTAPRLVPGATSALPHTAPAHWPVPDAAWNECGLLGDAFGGDVPPFMLERNVSASPDGKHVYAAVQDELLIFERVGSR